MHALSAQRTCAIAATALVWSRLMRGDTQRLWSLYPGFGAQQTVQLTLLSTARTQARASRMENPHEQSTDRFRPEAVSI